MGLLFFKRQLKSIEYYALLWLLLSSISIFFNFDPYEKFFRVILISYHAPLFIAGVMFDKIKFKTSNVLNSGCEKEGNKLLKYSHLW